MAGEISRISYGNKYCTRFHRWCAISRRDSDASFEDFGRFYELLTLFNSVTNESHRAGKKIYLLAPRLHLALGEISENGPSHAREKLVRGQVDVRTPCSLHTPGS